MILHRKIDRGLCKVACVIAVVAVFMIFGTASSEAMPWKGVDWYEWGGASLYLDQSNGHLEVRPGTTNKGDPCAAWHTTPNNSRSTSTPWMMVSFLDDPGKRSTIELWITDNGSFWTQIGAGDGSLTYRISYWNFLTGDTDKVDTGIPRSIGQHTVKLGVQGNGKLDYWFDETLILSTDKIKPQYFGEIYLITQYSVGTFVDYQNGTDYSPPVSEINIDLDIKPGGNTNNINLRSQGVTPVAVLTTDDFEAGNINPDTVLFAGASPVRSTMEDVDGDGDDDMLFHFKTQDLNLNADSKKATLRGKTRGKATTLKGETLDWNIEGSDSVHIIHEGKKDKKAKES